MISLRTRLAALVVFAVFAAFLIPTRSDADPATTQATCQATEAMIGRGSVTIGVKVGPITIPVTVQVPEIGDAISQTLSTTELPLPIPTDVDAPSSIAPSGTIPYSGDLQIDLGASVADAMTAVRDSITAAGYPDLADTLSVQATAEDITVPFQHAAGTTPTGTPSATGTGVSAAFVGSATVLTVNSFAIDTDDSTPTPIDASLAWSVKHDGTTPGPLDLSLGTVTFDLDLSMAGSVPGDVVRPLVPVAYQSLIPDVVPVAGGASGPWACVPDDPGTAIARTSVDADSSTTSSSTTSTSTTSTTEDPTPVCESGFNDVGADHPFCDDIAWFADDGLTTGYADGSYRPAAPVTRQAIAAMFYRAAGSPAVPGDAPTFTDVPADHPFVNAIRWLASEEITTGYPDGTFKPSATMSRQGIAAMFYRSSGSPAVPGDAPTFTDVPADHPFVNAIRWLASEEITTGYPDGTFKPQSTVTRQSTAAFFHRWIT